MKEKKPDYLKRLLSFTGKSRGLLNLSQILSGISAVFILFPFICVYFAVRELINVFTGSGLDTSVLLSWGIRAVISELIGLVIYFAALLCSHVAAFNTEKNLKMAALRHLAKMPLGYFENHPSGMLRKIIDDNTFQTETFVAHQMADLVGAYVTMIISLVLMVAFDWRIGVPLLALYVIGFILQGSLIGKETAVFMKKYQDSLEEMNHEAVEYVRGIFVVKVFNQTVESFTRFFESIKKYRDYALSYTMACRKGMVVFTSLINSNFLVLIPVGLIVAFNTANLTDFTQKFLFYVIFTPGCAVMLNKIMYMTDAKMQAEESMRRIDTILQTPVQKESEKPAVTDGLDIVFENVSFTYENAGKKAVESLSFTVKKGTVNAIVGHSGSGKSTAASLIPRFHDCQEGSIKIGGIDVRDISHKDLMQKVGFVFQNPKLLKDTLLENIRMARPEATREEVLAAAHLAQCDDIIAKFKTGIDTVVGSKGVYLSGGEVQRIAIARAILKDSPIIILDEATAYADPENEKQIQKAFTSLMKDRTVIMIAHRLCTVVNADQILVMKDGHLVEKGTHSELLEKGTEYKMMWNNFRQTTEWHIEKNAPKIIEAVNVLGKGEEIKVC